MNTSHEDTKAQRKNMNDLNEGTKAGRIDAEKKEGIRESFTLRGFVTSCDPIS